MQNLNQLARLVNKLESFYEMSDNPKVWELNDKLQSIIKKQLDSLSKQNFNKLKTLINPQGNINLNRYFKY